MWTTRKINGYTCQVKHYDEPSEEFGLNGGRISKIWIGKDGKDYVNYDRGWDKLPTTKEAKQIFEVLLKEFN